ncbi:hypothetical protein [Oceanibaculum indicum]|uniref:Uncharacterized protein n=1 Tax=Oceanibaculum indicum TaxID=526216 RepID=A0A420WGM5_9PROT|nr:hypothetical protein [Oceanibaculum indicum]RKQ70116.1 hypothetical protein BCL74_2056 [Oceanibaculum indicum]
MSKRDDAASADNQRQASAALFDIAALETVGTDVMTVRHPVTGAATDWKWTIAGPGHPVAEALRAEFEREQADRQRRIEMARVNGKKWKGDDEDPAETDRRHNQRAAKRVLEWTAVTVDGAPFPCTPENVMRIATEPRWRRVWGQFIEYLVDEKSFTKSSASS